jgi:preprotein translocase subunit YajC
MFVLGQQSAQQTGTLFMVVWMGLLLGIFYVIAIRPQRRRERERQDMIGSLKTGDRVMFAGGLIGTIANVKESTFIVRIAEKVKIEVSRGAVSHQLEKGEVPADPGVNA